MKKKLFIFIFASILIGTLCACSSKNSYKVQYILNGGNADNLQEEVDNRTEYELPQANKEGYTFYGWYQNADFDGDAISKIPIGNKDDLILYAKFQKNRKATYITNGGEHSNQETFTVEDVIELQPAKKTGFVFVGWYANEEFTGNKIIAISKRDKDINLFAKFSIAYNITYELNGGTNNVANPTEFCEEELINLKNPTQNGKNFLGWYDENNQKVVSIPRGTTTNVYLRAEWENATYKLTWNLVGGQASTTYPTQYTYGIGIPESKFIFPTKAEMVFAGWYVDSNNSSQFINGISEKDYGDMDIYAKWVTAEALKIGNIWRNNSQTQSANGDAAYLLDATTITVPNELKNIYEMGKLGIEITGVFFANVRAQGDATATAKAYLIVNGAEHEVASSTAKGGGYDYWHGFWQDPITGQWSYSGDRTRSVRIVLNEEEIKIGYRYSVSSDKTNSKGIISLEYGCTQIVGRFYIV